MLDGQPVLRDILIVDDMPDNLRLLATMLTENGYRVRAAPSGNHTLAAVRKKIPTLFFATS